MAKLFSQPGTTPLSSIVDQVTELSIFVDDFLATHPNLLCWRQSPHDMPRFADSEVLTLALLQGCLGGRESPTNLSAGGGEFSFCLSAPVFLSAMDRSLARPHGSGWGLATDHHATAQWQCGVLLGGCQAPSGLSSGATSARAPAAGRRRVVWQNQQGLVLWF